MEGSAAATGGLGAATGVAAGLVSLGFLSAALLAVEADGCESELTLAGLSRRAGSWASLLGLDLVAAGAFMSMALTGGFTLPIFAFETISAVLAAGALSAVLVLLISGACGVAAFWPSIFCALGALADADSGFATGS